MNGEEGRISPHQDWNGLMNIARKLGPLLPFAGFFLFSVLFLSFSRMMLVWLNWERIPDWHSLIHILISGIRMDTVLLCMVLVVPVFATLLAPAFITGSKAARTSMNLYLSFWVTLFILMESSTPAYITFFDTRPGRIFFEYLNYPKEVGSMLLGGFIMQSVFVVCSTVIGAVMAYVGLGRLLLVQTPVTYKRQLMILPLVLALLVLGGRSTLGHRPINASSVAFSNDQLLNELVLSSTYTVLNAVYGLKNEGDPSDLYPALPDMEVIRRVKRDSLVDEAKFHNPMLPTLHSFGSKVSKPVKNLVILLEESMGARFIGKLGGLPLSPEIDRLAEEGLWFTNLYATGIRSARGIEAVVTGFPPSAARSVLKLGLSQHKFYTMAQTLKENGYRNYFLYGGESHFDNMRGFLLNNGFDVAIDENDFTDWKFKGSWGVSDEDLFDKAHEIFQAETRPFFALVFSSSFHSPFEFPDGRIELHDEEKNTRNNAVKYADYAVGYFIEKAKKSDYWDDTLFLIVADHDERPRGSSLVPVSSYHIPALILGSQIEPQIYTKVTSQIDLMPTLFKLLGIRGNAPYIGQDIFLRPHDYPGRALMQFGNNHAYMLGDQVVIHRPEKDVLQFVYRNKELIPTDPDEELVMDALAWALVPGLLYKNQWYQTR